MIDRGTYWQGAYTVPKGGFAELRARGIEAFRATLRACLPFLGDRVDDVDWDGVGFLEVRVNRLASWSRPGLLCIGDAAHAMSPIGGVGINLAVQDAVAAANILAGPLLDRRVAARRPAAVQRRRELPTRVTQRLQLGMQRAMIGSMRADRARIPLPMRLASRFAPVRRIVSRFLALGVRNESVRSRRAAAVDARCPCVRAGPDDPAVPDRSRLRRFRTASPSRSSAGSARSVTVTVRDRRPALRGNVMDQSALRGLLALLWDPNADLISVHIRPEAHQP